MLKYWQLIRSSFWFIPGLMTSGAAMLALGMVALDQAKSEEWLESVGFAYTGGAEGATTVLGTIAGSMITIAGVVFSMTLVALSLASSQLGPRLLRNFMRDQINQVVLGTFVATFIYCLLVLRTIRREEGDVFVPHLAVTLGVVLAVVSVGVLIYFIHHISLAIQADQIVARVGRELTDGIDDLFPDHLDPSTRPSRSGGDNSDIPPDFDSEARPVLASRDGYVQSVDIEALRKLATEKDVVFRVERAPGTYVVEHRPLTYVWPAVRVTEELARRVNSTFVLGSSRTPGQDLQFSVDQLVEIAVRALSPGVNDPFTAVRCVDRLGSALCRLAQREIPSPHHYDAHHRLRVIHPPETFPAVLDTAFNQIRQNAASNAAVLIRLLETLAVVATFVERAEDREALRRHAKTMARVAERGLTEEEDLSAVNQRHAAVMEVLDRPTEENAHLRLRHGQPAATP
ncbi:MAG: DUF2254 domain-containing protein [Gemmatimonadota bacterium]